MNSEVQVTPKGEVDVSTSGAVLPFALAAFAWLLPIGFGLWAFAQFGLRSRTLGLPEEAYFTFFGAIPGLFSAGTSLFLLRKRRQWQLPTFLNREARVLAISQMLVTALAALFFLGR